MFQNMFQDGSSEKSAALSCAPTPSFRTKAGPRKLRASCDSCYLAKIKCTKGTPSCARCLSHGEQCNYSPSQRTGKPKRVHREESGRSEDTNESGRTSAPPLRSFGNAPVRTRSFSWDMEPRNTDFGPEVEIPEDFPTLWQDDLPVTDNDGHSFMYSNYNQSLAYSQGILPTAIEPALGYTKNHCITDQSLSTSVPSVFEHALNSQPVVAPRDTPRGAFPQNCQTQLPTASNSAKFQLGSRQSQPSILRTIQPDILPTIANTPYPSCTCTTRTHKILSGLHISTAQALTFPQILSTNSTAVTEISHLLSCSCSLDFPSILLLATIMSKILSSYQSIASSSPSATPSASNDTTIIVGGFTLETGVDESHIRMQVVLSELKKVEGLLSRFQERFCNAGRKGEQRIYLELSIYMRRTLRNIVDGVQRDLLPGYEGV